MLLARTACLLVFASGCMLWSGDETPSACILDQLVDAQIVYADQDGNVRAVDDDPNVPLVSAPQGGHILLIGARLHAKVTSCTVDVNAALRDPTNSRVIGLEQRPLTISSYGSDWAGPPVSAGLSDLTNVAVCPNEAAVTAIDGFPFRIEVRVIGSGGTVIANPSAMIMPTCGDTYCHMDCSPPGM